LIFLNKNLEIKKYERKATHTKSKFEIDRNEDDRSRLIDELIGFEADHEGYNVELRREEKKLSEIVSGNKMIKLGTVNEKINVTHLDESPNAKIVKKHSINVQMENSYLK
jgi:hypothetical protein